MKGKDHFKLEKFVSPHLVVVFEEFFGGKTCRPQPFHALR